MTFMIKDDQFGTYFPETRAGGQSSFGNSSLLERTAQGLIINQFCQCLVILGASVIQYPSLPVSIFKCGSLLAYYMQPISIIHIQQPALSSHGARINIIPQIPIPTVPKNLTLHRMKKIFFFPSVAFSIPTKIEKFLCC